MGEIEEFNTLDFEKKLMHLKDTQESIQSLSGWCLKQRTHHKKIVASWLNVLKRVKVEQRLVLFYLANDVIQYSKRKNYEFVESWGLSLQKATPLVRDEKVRPKILRIFKIWEQRTVYDEEFLSDLTGLLSAGAVKKTDDDPLDFQPQQLVNKIKQCTVLEADTDLRLKYIHESHLQLSDADALCASLKDRSNKDDVEKELNEGIACVEKYTQALQREIVAREALLALLTSANQYYSTQRGEVKVVAYAYKNFGARVRALKRKLDELIPTLPSSAPSPPQHDEDVPSPGPDEDLDLPIVSELVDDDVSYNIDKTFSTSLTADGSLYNMGLSSFLTSDNPMAIFNENQSSVTSATMSQKSQDTLPGLDLLTPESTGNPPPPTSFYGSIESTINDEPDQPYIPETTTPWNNSTWSIPAVSVPPPIVPSLSSLSSVPVGVPPAGAPSVPVGVPPVSTFVEPPASPPPAPRGCPPPPRTVSDTHHYAQDLPPTDVDHRGILPPPPPPPVLPILGHMEDVDHRLLPSLPPLPPAVTSTPNRHSNMQQDVDHRNLISLTHQLPSPRSSNPIIRPINQINLDQDYRVPPMVPPTDIVESVDMDLSEDEDQHGVYQSQQQNQNEHNRRHSFNNNKVLVGGDNGKINNADKHTNLIRINSVPSETYEREREKQETPHTAPVMLPLSNPFDNMPDGLMKPFEIPFQKAPPNFTEKPPETIEENSNDSAYEEDLRSRAIENVKALPELRNPSPPDFNDFSKDTDWSAPPPRPFMNQRFPRNWGPRTNFRPQGFGPQQFWPRNGPRPPNRPWMMPRPQRFW